MTIPPVPPQGGLHVLVVHFPVALLLVAPVLMFLAMFMPRRFPGFAVAAWVVLFIGTFSTWVAMKSGEDAFMETGEMSDAARAVLEVHRAQGHLTPWIFSGICAAYGILLLLPLIFKRLKVAPVRVLGTLAVLACYAWASLYLANLAHQGGRLVHEYGVRAPIAGEPDASPATTAAEK